MSSLIALALIAASAPVALSSGYLLLFVCLSSKPRPLEPGRRYQFKVIVPAHNEEAGISRTLRSLRELDYPREAFSVLVIADNCTDATALRAREAGAEVLERTDPERRGKGYALQYAFERLTEDTHAVVVVDADTLVSRNLLSAFAARLERGAHAVQADYAVSNPLESWRTRLMAIALGAFHVVRSRARERLSLSAGLRGNGMCFTRDILQRVAHDAYSIVEDVEYGIRLAESGCRVHYADEAHVYGEMVSTSAAARSQRARWEGGRKDLARAHGFRLIRKGLETRDRVLLDLGFDLLVPPLAQLAVAAVVGTTAAGGAALAWGGPIWLAFAGWGTSLSAIGIYVLRGWSLSGTGVRGLLDLGFAPGYVLWKLSARARREQGSRASWVRTTREGERRDVA